MTNQDSHSYSLKETHKARHKILHHYFDELMADFIAHTKRLPSETTLQELGYWSHQQTINPAEFANDQG